MKTDLVAAFALLLVSLVLNAQYLEQTKPEEVGMSADRLQYLTETFQEYIDNDQMSGSVILVARKGKIPYYKAFGYSDKEANIKMPKDAIFRIASQTKAIVSVGIMILQERGDLLISDPVGKYIPDFLETTVAEPTTEKGNYKVVPAKRPITIRDLLTHTAGIGYGHGIAKKEWKQANITDWYFADRKEPVLETVKRMAKLPMDAHPGERFEYGYGTDILGAVIEVVSKQNLNEFLKAEILGPLGMNDTYFYLPKDKSQRLAAVYSTTADGLKRAPESGGMDGQGAYVDGPRISFSGGAGLVSTARDYLNFLQMMLDKGKFNGNRTLSKKTVELMTVDHLQDVEFPWIPGTGFGLGFNVVEDIGDRGELGSLGEFGWGGAYHSTYWVDPKEELIVVYFTQLLPAEGIDDHQKLRSLVYQAIIE